MWKSLSHSAMCEKAGCQNKQPFSYLFIDLFVGWMPCKGLSSEGFTPFTPGSHVCSETNSFSCQQTAIDHSLDKALYPFRFNYYFLPASKSRDGRRECWLKSPPTFSPLYSPFPSSHQNHLPKLALQNLFFVFNFLKCCVFTNVIQPPFYSFFFQIYILEV